MNKKLYLAGPMTGIPGFNFPAFTQAAADLRARGYEVFNPAEKDNELYGEGIGESKTGSVEEIKKTHGFDPRATIKVDVNWVIDNADVIALLPGWENSKGVAVELAAAKYLNLEIMYLG